MGTKDRPRVAEPQVVDEGAEPTGQDRTLVAAPEEKAVEPTLDDTMQFTAKDGELCKEIYTAAKEAAQAEETLRAGIDSRAAAQVTASGVSLTIGSTVGTFLLKEATAIGPAVGPLFFLIVAMACAGVSVFFAVHATRVDKHKALNNRSVFIKILDSAQKESAPDKRLIHWRSSVAYTLVNNALANEAINERRLDSLRKAQVWYMVFLGVFVVTLILLAIAVARRLAG